MLYLNEYESTVGKIYLLTSSDKLYGLYFSTNAIKKKCLLSKEYRPVAKKVATWLTLYFNKTLPPSPSFLPPLALEGSPFCLAVWHILLTLPYGKTISYKEVAKLLARGDEYKGKSKNISLLSRAVGGAVGKNPISIIIPCHRVIKSNGELGGYNGGVERKKRLLALEKALPLSYSKC